MSLVTDPPIHSMDKRTKAYKESVGEVTNNRFIETTQRMTPQQLAESGIPLESAHFHPTILSYAIVNGGEPVTALYSPKAKGTQPKPFKLANMWWTPHGLVIEQKGIYKMISLCHVTDSKVLT